MRFRLSLAAVVAAVSALLFSATGLAADPSPHPIGDGDLNATSKRFEDTAPQNTARTIWHWVGQTTNPVNGGTYAYSIVDAHPHSEERPATIRPDILPLTLTIA